MIFLVRASGRAGKKNSVIRGAVAVACWAYVVALVACWLLLRFAGESWWVATVMLFGPRWVVLIPLPLLLLFTAIVRPRYLGVLALASWFVVDGLMGLCVSWRNLITPT